MLQPTVYATNNEGQSWLHSFDLLAKQARGLPEMVDVTVDVPEQICTKCGISKKVNEFSYTQRDGRARQCKRCRLDAAILWRKNNPDKAHAAYGRRFSAWREKNPKLPPLEPIVGADGRLCRSCEVRKPNEEFGAHTGGIGGLARRCKACARADHTRWREANRDHVRDVARGAQRKKKQVISKEQMRLYNKRARLKRNYGMSIDEFNARVAIQDGKCAICSAIMRTDVQYGKGESRVNLACVDHCHETDKIRDILCNRCNRGIGMFSDDTDLIEKALAYLKRHSNG